MGRQVLSLSVLSISLWQDVPQVSSNSYSSHGSSCVCLSVYRARIPADLLYQQWNTAFIHPTACLSYRNFANHWPSPHSVCLCFFMHLLHLSCILILLEDIKQRHRHVIVLQNHWHPKIGDLSGSWLCGGFVLGTLGFTKDCMHGSGRRREDSPEGAGSPLFCCVFYVWVGLESSLLNTLAVLWVWLQTDGLMARSNKQSLDIRLKSLSALWKTRCKPLLYLCHTDYAIRVCDIERAEECVVIQYCTSALTAVHRDHCLAGLWLNGDWRVGRHSTNKGVFTKWRFVSEACSFRLSVCLSSVLAIALAQRWVGKLGAYSALCSSSIDESNASNRVIETPSPRYHPCFLSPLHHTLPLLFLSNSSAPLFLLPDHHPSRLCKHLLLFVEA